MLAKINKNPLDPYFFTPRLPNIKDENYLENANPPKILIKPDFESSIMGSKDSVSESKKEFPNLIANPLTKNKKINKLSSRKSFSVVNVNDDPVSLGGREIKFNEKTEELNHNFFDVVKLPANSNESKKELINPNLSPIRSIYEILKKIMFL